MATIDLRSYEATASEKADKMRAEHVSALRAIDREIDTKAYSWKALKLNRVEAGQAFVEFETDEGWLKMAPRELATAFVLHEVDSIDALVCRRIPVILGAERPTTAVEGAHNGSQNTEFLQFVYNDDTHDVSSFTS